MKQLTARPNRSLLNPLDPVAPLAVIFVPVTVRGSILSRRLAVPRLRPDSFRAETIGVIAAFQRVYRVLAGRPVLRVTLQALVSLSLIALLVHAAQSNNLADSLGRLRGSTIVFAAALGLAQIALASCRWQILLTQTGVREPLGRLGALYLIGQFFSLFLPTSTGGDAVRVYEVARRNGQAAAVLLATLQERMLGLGSALLIGAAATLYYLPLLPPELRAWAVLLQLAGAVGLMSLLYPAPLIRLVRWLGRISGIASSSYRSRLIQKVFELARPVANLSPLPAARFALLLLIALVGTWLGVAMYTTVGSDLEVQAGFVAFCLVVPLVWMVRMAPISLNGIGVGEGAFVFLMGLFDVPRGPALALALAMLGLQTSLALLGGLLLVLRMVQGNRQTTGTNRPPTVVRTDAPHDEQKAAPHRRAA